MKFANRFISVYILHSVILKVYVLIFQVHFIVVVLNSY